MLIAMDENELLAEAERLFLYDAEFHARVEMAAQVCEADLRNKTGQRMTDDDRALALHAAAVALVLANRNPATDLPW